MTKYGMIFIENYGLLIIAIILLIKVKIKKALIDKYIDIKQIYNV